MVILTHAHACRAAHGSGYEQFARQRRNIMSQVLRQAAGDQQVGVRILVSFTLKKNSLHKKTYLPTCWLLPSLSRVLKGFKAAEF